MLSSSAVGLGSGSPRAPALGLEGSLGSLVLPCPAARCVSPNGPCERTGPSQRRAAARESSSSLSFGSGEEDSHRPRLSPFGDSVIRLPFGVSAPLCRPGPRRGSKYRPVLPREPRGYAAGQRLCSVAPGARGPVGATLWRGRCALLRAAGAGRLGRRFRRRGRLSRPPSLGCLVCQPGWVSRAPWGLSCSPARLHAACRPTVRASAPDHPRGERPHENLLRDRGGQRSLSGDLA